MLQRDTYKKAIPTFYAYLLNQISRVEVVDSKTGTPSEFIHYQPSKTSIAIHTGSVIKLSHELSHAIEMAKPERLTLADFGMKTYYPSTVKGQLQSIARESRARGIQSRLVELAFGYRNYLHLRTAGDYLSHLTGTRFGSILEVKQWSNHLVESAHREWTEDKIVSAWADKANYLNNWMES